MEELLAYRGSANSLAGPNNFEANLIKQCKVMIKVKASILIQEDVLPCTSCRVGGGQYGCRQTVIATDIALCITGVTRHF